MVSFKACNFYLSYFSTTRSGITTLFSRSYSFPLFFNQGFPSWVIASTTALTAFWNFENPQLFVDIIIKIKMLCKYWSDKKVSHQNSHEIIWAFLFSSWCLVSLRSGDFPSNSRHIRANSGQATCSRLMVSGLSNLPITADSCFSQYTWGETPILPQFWSKYRILDVRNYIHPLSRYHIWVYRIILHDSLWFHHVFWPWKHGYRHQFHLNRS